MADTSENQEGQASTKQGKRDRIFGYFGSADFWTALATIFLVIVGIWGVVETRHALELAERATVTTLGVQLNRPPAKNEGISFAVLFLNSGKSPAIDLNTRFRISTIDAYDPTFASVTNIEVPPNTTCVGLAPVVGRTVIPPSQPGFAAALTHNSIHADPPYRVDDRILGGSKFAVVQGCAAYSTRERAHKSAFCYILESRSGDNDARTYSIATCAGGFNLD